MKANLKQGEALTSFKKDNGPPHGYFNAIYDPLEANEYLLEKKVDIEALKSVHKKGDVAV